MRSAVANSWSSSLTASLLRSVRRFPRPTGGIGLSAHIAAEVCLVLFGQCYPDGRHRLTVSLSLQASVRRLPRSTKIFAHHGESKSVHSLYRTLDQCSLHAF